MFRPIPNPCLFVLFFFCLISSKSFAQNLNDDVNQILKANPTELPDSSLLKGIDYATKKWQETVRSKLDSSLIYAKKAADLALELKNDSLLFHAYRRATNSLIQLGKLDEARSYSEKMKSLFDESDLYEGFRYYNNLGMINYYEGNYEVAVENHLTALEFAEKGELVNNIPAAYGEIARVFDAMDQPLKALEYAKKDVDFTMQHGEIRGKFIANYNLGGKYVDLDSFDLAIAAYELSDSLGKELNIPVFNAALNLSKGRLFIKMDEADKAVPILLSAESVMSQVGDVRGKQTAQLNLAKAYNQLGKYDLSKELLESLYPQFQSQGYEELLEICRKEYAESLYQTGNGSQAYEIYKEYKEVQDSIKSKNTQKAINELDIKYQTAEKERLINFQNLELERAKYFRNLLIGGLAMAIWFGTFLVLYFWYRNKSNKKIALQAAEIQDQKINQLEQEKSILAMSSMIEGQEAERKRIAMDLHDGLGGILVNIKSQLHELEKKVNALSGFDLYGKATGMIDNASQEVRRIAFNMMPVTLSRLGLKAAIEDMIAKTSLSNSINITFHSSGLENRRSETQEVMIYRIIQELVNNVIKHAQANNLFIELNEVDNDILITVEDDGIGFDVKKGYEAGGLGMKSIDSRIKYLNGSLDVISNEEGSSFNILIPSKTVQV